METRQHHTAIGGNGAIPEVGIYDSDFVTWYTFSDWQTINADDIITANLGVVTLQNFFSDADARLPDLLFPPTAVLADQNGSARSAVIAIPEPSSVLLLTAVLQASG